MRLYVCVFPFLPPLQLFSSVLVFALRRRTAESLETCHQIPPSGRVMHISTCLYLCLPVAFRRPASVSISISHTHTLTCAYITTLSRAEQQGRAREGDGGDE